MKLMTVALMAILMGANVAHASKARVKSLLGTKHLVDTQTAFTYPQYVTKLSDLIAFEFGPTGQGTTDPKAEGGIYRKYSDATMALYLGHHDEVQSAARTLTTYPMQTNPLQFFYGKANWGFTVGLSNTDKKTAKEKETTLFGGFGMDINDITLGANVELLANAEKDSAGTTKKYTGAPHIGLNMLKYFGDNYMHAALSYSDMKAEQAAGDQKLKNLGAEVGFVDRSLKNANRDLYYGISLAYSDLDVEGKHRKTMTLPLSLGVEHNLNTWAVARASITQNFLLGNTQDEIGTTAPADAQDTIANNTTVSAGLGFNYSNITLDGVLSASKTGDVNGNAVLANAGVTYKF